MPIFGIFTKLIANVGQIKTGSIYIYKVYMKLSLLRDFQLIEPCIISFLSYVRGI